MASPCWPVPREALDRRDHARPASRTGTSSAWRRWPPTACARRGAAYEMFQKKADGCIKVVLKPEAGARSAERPWPRWSGAPPRVLLGGTAGAPEVPASANDVHVAAREGDLLDVGAEVLEPRAALGHEALTQSSEAGLEVTHGAPRCASCPRARRRSRVARSGRWVCALLVGRELAGSPRDRASSTAHRSRVCPSPWPPARARPAPAGPRRERLGIRSWSVRPPRASWHDRGGRIGVDALKAAR